MPERIDLSRADDPRDIVHQVVACLAQGGMVGLPTESSYSILAGALHLSTVERLQSLARRSSTPLAPRASLFLKGLAEVDDWADVSSDLGRKLSRRAWPGPVTLIFPTSPRGLVARLPVEVKPFLVVDGSIALRVPSGRLVREVLRLLPGPVIQVEPLDESGEEPALADELERLDELDMLIEIDSSWPGGVSTVVEVGHERWTMVRSGLLGEDDLARMAGTILLFVCTGNTCRSPMAEALCKTLLARRIGCQSTDLIDRGFVVISAGVSAMEGMPAASNAIEVVRSRGASLDEHASRRASTELVRQADYIIAMTADHLDILLDHVPEVAPRARLLHTAGDDIADPVGSDLSTYQSTAREIEQHLDRLLDELGF